MERKLKVERRESTGKGAARKIRARGSVPGVVYGQGGDPLHIAVDARELFHILHTEAGANVLVDMRVDGDSFLAMPREVQRDHLRDRLLHVDFLRIARDEKISVEVPIHLTGESRGVKEGGVVEHHLWDVHLECLPQDVPSAIEADITPLAIGDSLKVDDLTFSDRWTVLTPGEEVVVSVVTPQVLQVEEEVPEEEAAALAEGEAAEGAPAPGEGAGEQAGEAGSES